MKRILLVMSALLLAACQHNPARPSLPPAPVPPSAMELAEQVNDASAKRFDTVEQRITLIQEKLIELNQRLERLSLQEQLQLAALQALQQASQEQTNLAAPVSNASSGSTTLDQLTELVFRLEQMSSDAQSASPAESRAAMAEPRYLLVSVYGPKGWVVLKYDSLTGSAWLAEAGSWKRIEEVGVLPESEYQVVMQLAPGDVKGYVAARIDRGNGIAWWLKDNQWEPF